MTSLYIHIPFCISKCFYCSFVVSVGQAHRMNCYLDCIEQEARQYRGTSIQTIYIGGGTPTLLNDSQLEKLFNIVYQNFCFLKNIEWTIEANPEGLDISKLKMIKEKGINRISLGVQSLNDKYLKYLGRNHDSAAAVKSFNQLRKAGFDNINVDMMFSFPDQSMNELKSDINEITQLDAEHLSLYSLTIEKNSRFFAQNIQLQDDQNQAEMYRAVCEGLKKKGYEQYEVSNFSKPKKVSNHNINYWEGGQYIGLGIGAHSHIGKQRFWNISRLSKYISSIQNGHSIREGHEELSSYNKMKETVLFGLRMNRGIDMKRIEQEHGCFFESKQKKKINHFIAGGLLIEDNGRLRTSDKGRMVLDELCAQLV